MFPDNISQNIDILVIINVWKNSFGFHSNQKTQGQKRRVNNLNFKYQVCQMILSHFNTFLQFRLLFHEPHCSWYKPFALKACFYKWLKIVRCWSCRPWSNICFAPFNWRVYDKKNCGTCFILLIWTKNRGSFILTQMSVFCKRKNRVHK